MIPNRVIRPSQGEILGPIDGVRDRFLIDSHQTEGRLAVVEHLLAPRSIAAPVHRHHLEDEFTFVIEGKLGAIFDGVEVFAEPGDLILKPRGEWHTFWNPSDKPTRVLELITPGGLEDFFRKIDLGVTDEELERLAAAAQCDVDMAQTGPLLEKYGLTFGREVAH
ncbi:cupin domain-containing protein [Antrihabitans sp. NCIMB 15449]|jgi:mannose-6-phosphate isomerase-like protein (cupin superfamily)|uniref:Cupin domain-containing protein n=1 Tax=Antrihabitans spumae TaxID=3373370 RepID=A0ABW7JRG1_9NOCA